MQLRRNRSRINLENFSPGNKQTAGIELSMYVPDKRFPLDGLVFHGNKLTGDFILISGCIKAFTSAMKEVGIRTRNENAILIFMDRGIYQAAQAHQCQGYRVMADRIRREAMTNDISKFRHVFLYLGLCLSFVSCIRESRNFQIWEKWWCPEHWPFRRKKQENKLMHGQ